LSSSNIISLCEQALSNQTLSRDEIVKLLSLSDVESLEILRQASEEALRQSVGEAVRAVFFLPVSTFCEHNCVYCDYRSDNSDVSRFRLAVEDVVEMISSIPSGTDSFLLLDGAQDSSIDLEYVSSLFKALESVENVPELVFAFGERTEDYYRKMQVLGMSNYVLEHKTTSPILYNTLHPEQNFFERRKSLDALRKLDINIGTSIMVGYPEQDLWDLADDYTSIMESQMKIVIVGPFVPGPSSPLADSPRGTIQSALNAVAVARLLFKDVFIPAGPSFGVLDSGSPVEALRWGADGVMLYLTPRQLATDCSKVNEATDFSESARVIVQPDFDYVATRVCSLGRAMRTGKLF
jgi:biotin synthase